MVCENPILNTDPMIILEEGTFNERVLKWAMIVTPGIHELCFAEMESSPGNNGFVTRTWQDSIGAMLSKLQNAQPSALYMDCVTLTFDTVTYQSINMEGAGLPGITFSDDAEQRRYDFHVTKQVYEQMLRAVAALERAMNGIPSRAM